MNQGTRALSYTETDSALLQDQEAFFSNPQVLMDEISPEMIDEIAINYSRGMKFSRAWDELDSATRGEIRMAVKSIVAVSLPVLLRHEVVNP
ncbi:hypothetical protein ACXA45_04035 [Neomicrococcus lactis]